MKELPPIALMTYSELLDRLLVGAYGGKGLSLFTRRVKGRDYWYLQLVVGEHKRSFYLGPDSEAMRKQVSRARLIWESAQADASETRRLVSALAGWGMASLSGRELRVMQALAQSGVFLAGGVLVGSHAFQAIGNMLGVSWQSMTRTQDIDIASDFRIRVGLPDREVDIEKALRQADKGFFPVPALDPRNPSTAFRIRGVNLRVDLLTPMVGRSDNTPVQLRSINGFATPVRFLDYLIEQPEAAALIGGEGVLVNVPSPGRFAIHKLVVSSRRPAAMDAKRRKDVGQAAQVLEVLFSDRPGDVDLALDAACGMPRKFMEQLRLGAQQLTGEIRSRIEMAIDDALARRRDASEEGAGADQEAPAPG